MSKRREQNSGNGIPNPAKKFIDFHGKKGIFHYYDKNRKDDSSTDNGNVEIKPKFLIVMELTTVTGFNRTHGGLYSNEVRDLSEDLDVKYYKGNNKNIVKGPWAEIKDKVNSKAVNGKFTRSIYVALFHNKEWSLQNIKLSGKQLTSWIEILAELKTKGINPHDVMFSVDKVEYVENGDTPYYFPTFKYTLLDENNADQKAIMVKADNYYDVIEDFIEKRKSGANSNEPSARVAQDNTDTSKAQVQAAESGTPFEETASDDNDDDLPW